MTTKADTSVKFGLSTVADAPVMRGQAGAMIELLDAVLVNGYCIRTVDSVVVASEVATVSISAGVPYPEHAVIAMSGASVSALNDEWRIHSVTGSSFKFNCPGVADGTATGTLSVKMAPAGWVKAFSGTNLAAYRSADPASTGVYLWVDDSDARFAKVRGYEAMTAIDAGTNPFPTLAQYALSNFTWAKSNAADASSRKWGFCGDGRMMHVPIAFLSNTPSLSAFHRFGDLVAHDPADVWACEIIAHTSSAPNGTYAGMYAALHTPANSQGSSRPRDALGNYAPSARAGACHVTMVGEDAYASDQIFASPIVALDSTTTTSRLRGTVPGVLVVRNHLITNMDYAVANTGADLLFFVRASDSTPNEAELIYGAFSLAPNGGWR